MTHEHRETSMVTHDVVNQSPEFADVNLFTSDRALLEAVEREGAGARSGDLTALGARMGSAEALELGRVANANPPALNAFDAKGHRIDRVDYHPTYHALMAESMGAGLHCASWQHLADATSLVPGTNVARAAGLYMAAQMEAGHCCPITMTNASVATLLHQPDLAEAWVPKILGREYDRTLAAAGGKSAVTIGMAMTEKQGGTDVRANTTRAAPIASGGPGSTYRITGHKWFMSAPMSDAFLVLAKAPGGLSCFLMPRILPDGRLNRMRLQRLKDKLGNRSNASSEVEFHDAEAWMVGEDGRGVATIIEMVNYTRLDCAVASAGLMRLCLANAVHHCRHRAVFGDKLIDQPVMQHLLADMALDVEAATALAMRLARSFDHPDDPRETAWRRVMTPVTKYWICKIAPALAHEAMECLGGNGYVEEGLLARAYREVPVNAIWEGSGNVMCLDVIRVMKKDADMVEAVFEAFEAEAADDTHLSAHLERVRSLLHRPREIEANARTIVEGMALLAAGCLLNADAPLSVATAFNASRLGGHWRHTYGAGLARVDHKGVLERILPESA